MRVVVGEDAWSEGHVVLAKRVGKVLEQHFPEKRLVRRTLRYGVGSRENPIIHPAYAVGELVPGRFLWFFPRTVFKPLFVVLDPRMAVRDYAELTCYLDPLLDLQEPVSRLMAGIAQQYPDVRVESELHLQVPVF